MGVKKIFSSNDKKTFASNLYQVIDVIQEDIYSEQSRRKYETFVTSSANVEVGSSIFQTVYDQDFSYQTSNPVLDMTVGLFHNALRPNLVTQADGYTLNENGYLGFNNNTLMMREKVNVYRQYAQILLGNADYAFSLENGAAKDNFDSDQNIMDACVFINIKRLFHRDGIRKETFAMRLYKTLDSVAYTPNLGIAGTGDSPTVSDVQIIADISNSSAENIANNSFGYLRLASDTTKKVGLIFYKAGIVVLNMGTSTLPTSGRDEGNGGESTTAPIFEPTDTVEGVISAVNPDVNTILNWPDSNQGTVLIGVDTTDTVNYSVNGGTTFATSSDFPVNAAATFYPDFLVSGSIDNIVDHIANNRFGNVASGTNGQLTGIAFQNITKINSSIYFCRAGADEFNYSTNPSFINPNTNLAVMQETATDTTFTYITTVLMYDDNNNVVATAKVNRPLEKDPESEVNLRIRLDF